MVDDSSFTCRESFRVSTIFSRSRISEVALVKAFILMSFSVVSGVVLKLLRLFLMIWRSVLVRMATNCKVSGSSCCFSKNSSKVKEQLPNPSCACDRRTMSLICWFFIVLFGSIWISQNTVDKKISQMEGRIGASWEENASILQQYFNISFDHARALAPLLSASDTTVFECLERSAAKKQLSRKLVDHYVEVFGPPDMCLKQHKHIYEKLGQSSIQESVLFAPTLISCARARNFAVKEANQNNFKAETLGNCGKEYLERLPLLLLKIFWLLLVGLAIYSEILGRCDKRGHKNVHQQQQQQQVQQQQQQLQNSKSCGTVKWRRKLLILWIFTGVIGSIWIFWSMNGNIVLRRNEMLANMCDERARMLQDQFNVSMNHVHALAILVSTFHHGKHHSAIDQKTFAEYTARTAFERPLTSGVAYALKVLHSEREQFEREYGFTIKKMEADKSLSDEYIPENLDPAPVQDEYAPVILSQETVSHIVSIDMMSGKEDRDNILRARASGKGVLTSPFKLLKSNHLGVVLTFAVYNTDLPPDATPEERSEATQGYLGASFDVPSLVEKLLQQLASKQTIVVNVHDTTNSSAPIKMYGPDPTDTGLSHVSNLDFGDPSRKHEMHCRFKQKSPLPWSAITTSLGVLVIALLIGHIFHAALNRIAKVEDDYRKMMELKVRAEAADVAKSQFLATVSHEIRTPMNGVLGMLQMLMDTELDATQQDYATTAQASGKALIALINAVLDQAKIESGRLELEAVPFDIRSILDNVLSLISDKSQEKGIELAVYVSDRVPEFVVGDPGRFRQIITNLVGNSIKFTEQGHILVSVHVADEVKGLSDINNLMLEQQAEFARNGTSYSSYNTLSGYPVVDRWKSWENFKLLDNRSLSDEKDRFSLLVTVEDTGVGIPREAQNRIFMPFMQADSSTSRTYGGTGIGLSISKCLVDLMGGKIGFVSDPGVGSTFAFTVAFTKGQMNSLDVKRNQSDSFGLEFKGMRGLVVDGRSVRSKVTKYHLARLGIQVETAMSQKSAVALIYNSCSMSATNHLDMVLIDKDAWGKGTGLRFPTLLKELLPDLLESLPKIFLLATSISPADSEMLGGCVDNVIKKPLRLSMVAACVQQGLGMVKKRAHDVLQPLTLRNLLTGKRILVVDDNVVNRRVAAGALNKYGAEVTCAESGKAALESLRPPHLFDACFMDVQMPEMDGFEATRKVRLLEKEANEQIKLTESSEKPYGRRTYWHIPILAMTADVIQATHEECARCGMDGYVSKPFEEEHLYNAVARFFNSEAAVRT